MVEESNSYIIDVENDDELPLSWLQKRVSSKTFSWLQCADEEETRRQTEFQDDEAANGIAGCGKDGIEMKEAWELSANTKI